MIERHFGKNNPASVVFDPVPSYGGDWFFTIDNLSRNAKWENDINLWDEFYKKTYQVPLEKIFKTSKVLDIKVGMISKPNTNNIGRCLRYNKIDFFSELTNFLNQSIDNYGLNEEQNKSRINELISHINDSNENLNLLYSEAFKEKMKKLKDLLDKEFNSDYFESAMKDYAPFKSRISFTDYIKSLYEKANLYQMGLLRMGDFFDRNIDYKELYKMFDADIFYLLFAKIIYEFNLEQDEMGIDLQNSYRYLGLYKCALGEVAKEDGSYSPKIAYYLRNGEEIRYSSWEFINDLELFAIKHPELKDIKLPEINKEEEEKYKDISLMDKLSKLKDDSIKVNWQFLDIGEFIKKGHGNINDNLNIQNVNMRISILENSGYIARPLQGLNLFMGYYAFIYQNGLVIIEKFWDDIDIINPSLNSATYVINIDEFIELSKLEDVSLADYMKTLPNVKRIFHTSINNWQRNLFDMINGKYNLDDALNFINTIQSDEVKYDK